MGFFSIKTADDYIKKAMNRMANPHRSSLRNYQIVSDLLDKANQLDPNNFQIYFLKGWLNNHHKYYKLAIIDTNLAIEIKPDYADAYYNRGFAKFQLDDLQGALLDMNKAIELKSDFQEAIEDRKTIINKMND